jgi:hypothetical protein
VKKFDPIASKFNFTGNSNMNQEDFSVYWLSYLQLALEKMNLIKVHYMHVWNFHNETLLYN